MNSKAARPTTPKTPGHAEIGVGLRSQILEGIGHAVVVIDLEGRIIFWNKSAEAFFGWREDEALGRDLRDLTVPEAVYSPSLWSWARVPEGQAWSGEMLLQRRDCSSFCAMLADTPLHDAEGRVIGRICATTDISARKEMEERLRESEAQLRALAHHLTTVREEEATRIAREIHDQMGQALTALKMEVAALEIDVRESVGEGESPLLTQTSRMSSAITLALETANKLCTELRPAVLDKLGLIPALEWAARDFEERSGIFCNLELPVETGPLDDSRATAMFRIFQEMMTNIIRHAHATEVTIRLTLPPGVLRLEVSDDGHGIAPEKRAELGLGVIGMRERAAAVGGRIEFRKGDGRGTTVIAEIPHP